MKPPALGPVVYHAARHGFPTYVRQRAMALATNAHLAYVQVSSSPLFQIIAFDLAVVLLSFSSIYIVLHAAYAILEQTVLGESRRPREEKMRELDEIFKKYTCSIPEDEMDEFQEDFANFARRRGYRANGSLLPGGPSAEDDSATAPLASVDGDIPLLAKSFRAVEVPERPITPPPLPMLAAVISPGASSFVSLSHTSLAGNLTKAPVHIQPLTRKAYTPAHTLEAIAAQEGVSEPLTSRVALPRAFLGEQLLAATINGTYELGTGLVPGETLLGTTIPPSIPPLRQPISSTGDADEFASNAPLLRNDPLLAEGDALYGDVAPLAKADTPADEVSGSLAEGELAMPFAASGSSDERQIFIPPNASLTRMSPTADPARDIGIEQALNLSPMADSTLSTSSTASRQASSTASRPVNSTMSRRRVGSIASRPAGSSSTASSAPANPSSIRTQELFLGLFDTQASEEREEHEHKNNDSVVQAQAGASAGQADDSTAEGGTTYSHDNAPLVKLDAGNVLESDAPATSVGDATAAIEDDTPAAPGLDTSPSASPSSATDVVEEPSNQDVDDEETEITLQDLDAGSSHTNAADPAPPTSIQAERQNAVEERSTGHTPEDPIVVSPDTNISLSLSEGDITLTPDDDAHSDGVVQGDHSSFLTDSPSFLPADGRSVLRANGPRSAFDDSDEEEGDEDEEEEEEEEDIVDASALHNGTLSPIAEGADEDEEDGPAYHDVHEQSSLVRTDKEVVAAHSDEEVSPAHHERVEPGVSYAAAVRGSEGRDNAVWWTK